MLSRTADHFPSCGGGGGNIVIGFLALGIEKPYLFTKLNVMGAFFILFDISMRILHGKFISGKYGDMHHTWNFSRKKDHLPQYSVPWKA